MSIRDIVRTALRQAADSLESKPREGFVYDQLNELYRSFMQRAGDDLRNSYTWGAIHAAHLAKALGHDRVSLLEFGVAGGRGLLALDRVAGLLSEHWGIQVEVYGFDTGQGLPRPIDYRDLPNLWVEGQFPMDRAKLESRLERAKLVIGHIKDTLSDFMAGSPAPVGFVSIDLDLYSSTKDALKLLDGPSSLLLPRIQYYFDDIQGFTFSEFNGERLAIDEFNHEHDKRKISPIYGLRHFVPAEESDHQWVELFYMAHLFDHEQYNQPDGLLTRTRLDI
ncbi:hypothetical protein [Haliangium sp.]|uniref:hypothetical protein n=1 Tax=Haliangium sp. TaxID=2663208 RepID=UPI003D0C49D0